MLLGYNKSMKKITFYLALLVALGAALPALANTNLSFIPCGFSKDLEVGSSGEEVRCLQKFLNDNGFKVASSGVGSPGNETNLYGSLTAAAVKRWQSAKNLTASGTFGPLSRAAYLKNVSELASAQLSSLPSLVLPPVVTPAPVVRSGPSESDARELIQKARELIDDTEDDVDRASSSEINIDRAKRDIDSAKDDIIDALYAFLDGDYDKASDRANDVTDSLQDIRDDLHGDERYAQESIDDAQNAIDDASSEIDDAYRHHDSVDQANDKLRAAKNKLRDAQRQFDRDNFSEAEDLADQALRLAEDAVDAIGN